MNQKATTTDWAKFVSVMLVFILGMIIMLINGVQWIWVAYTSLWTWLEMKIANNIHLKWWIWVLILLGILILDFVIIQMIQ